MNRTIQRARPSLTRSFEAAVPLQSVQAGARKRSVELPVVIATPAIAGKRTGIAAAFIARAMPVPACHDYPETKSEEPRTRKAEANHSPEATPSARMPAADAPVMPAFERASS